MERQFRVEKTIETDVIWIRIFGRIESGPLDTFTKEIPDTAGSPPALPLLIDLSELKYISSMGIRMLLDLKSKLLRANCQFALISIPPTVSQVFQLLGLLQAFPHFESKEEALASFSVD